MATATTEQQLRRFIELAGMGDLSQAECARAVGVSERTGERWLARPEVRAEVERRRAEDPARSSIEDDTRIALDELLTAVDRHGSPDWTARARGADLLLKYQAQLDAAEQRKVDEEEFPEGVYIVFPRVTA